MVSRSDSGGRVAYLLQNPLNARDYERFGIPILLAEGVAVTVVDVSAVVHPHIEFSARPDNGFPDVESIRVSSAGEIELIVPKLAAADVIFNLAEGGFVTGGNLPVFRAIARAGKPYLATASNSFPAWNRQVDDRPSLQARVSDMFLRRRQIRPWRSLLARTPPGWLGATSPAFLVVGGCRSTDNRLAGSRTVTIAAHAMDYDIYLRELARRPAVSNIAVFIDENRPFHRDLKEMGYDFIVDPDEYFDKLRRLFDRIEKVLGLSVVIAANPRADYAGRPHLFGGRRIVADTTARAIAESRLVLAHRSTAIGFAVMFGKPVLQIATQDNYRHPTQRPYFDGFARALNKPISFYDDPDAADLTRAMDTDQRAYAGYMADYVKRPNSPDKPYWQIVLDELRGRGMLLSGPHLPATARIEKRIAS